ncbi:hypothetical protein BDV3_000473 [Batrachochytrium dendrobatidis]|nr:hypothetical protein BDEG_21497 [Batrachochytrium dendrobatidis JEL423]
MGRSAKFFRLGQTKNERDRIKISKNTKIEKPTSETQKKVTDIKTAVDAALSNSLSVNDIVMQPASSTKSHTNLSQSVQSNPQTPVLDKRGVPVKSKVLDKDYVSMMNSRRLQQPKKATKQ